MSGFKGFEWYEYPFYVMGLDTPMARFLAAVTLVNGVILTTQPGFCFTGKGEMRPWKVSDKKSAHGTWVPWWAPSIVAGLICSTVIKFLSNNL